MPELGLARLWDKHFTFIASERATLNPGPELSVTVRGTGELHDAVRTLMRESLLDDPVHLTYDFDPDELPFETRRGGIVTKIEIGRHRCECGNLVATTTIRALRHA